MGKVYSGKFKNIEHKLEYENFLWIKEGEGEWLLNNRLNDKRGVLLESKKFKRQWEWMQKATKKVTDLDKSLFSKYHEKDNRSCETEEFWDVERNKEIWKEIKKYGKSVWIRFGHLPTAGKSYNHAQTDINNYKKTSENPDCKHSCKTVFEDGVSVYHAYKLPQRVINSK